MPLAAFEKTWQFDVNRVLAASGAVLTTHRTFWRDVPVSAVAQTMSVNAAHRSTPSPATPATVELQE